MTWKDAGQLMLGTAALLTAVNATCNNYKNSERLDRHADRISENTKTIIENADASNDVAEAVGLPPMAAPVNLEQKK